MLLEISVSPVCLARMYLVAHPSVLYQLTVPSTFNSCNSSWSRQSHVKSEAGLYRQFFAISLSGDHSAEPIKPAKLRNLDDWHVKVERPTPAVSLQFKLSLFAPLDSEAASSLIRWMTRDSPTSIENIHFADQALTEANESSQLCNQLLDAQQPA